MCGIAGFVKQREDSQAVLEEMLRCIAHRGPDGEGTFVEGEAALGHRRLAIIDVEAGKQPLYNEDQSVVIVFNGEIYNYKQLREELVAAGHRFATQSDTEVLVHGYEQWGQALPGRLRGMFAFAIWDRNTHTLFCARDPFGIKPLYYYHRQGILLFGSEIKCFLPHPDFEKQLNHSQLELYLSFQYSPGEDTFFSGVKKLLPGCWMQYQNGALTQGRYWKAQWAPDETVAPAEWTERIHAAMADSVQAHMIADVPVSSFLSGGIDSNYIAALSGVPSTFTVGYADPKYSELEAVRASAKALGIETKSHEITEEEYWDNLGRIQYHMDEPSGDAAAAALFFLARTAAADVKVCLSGEGADELFGGYNVYTEPFSVSWYNRVPLFLRRVIGAVAERLPAVRGVNFLVRRSRPLEERYIGTTSLLGEHQKKKLLKHYEGKVLPRDLASPYLKEAKAQGLDPVLQMENCDINLWLVGDILLKADKMSMAHSLEVRVPFLDREVFRVASTVPAQQRVDASHTKKALRRAAEHVLPPEISKRRKLGFPVPMRAWLAEDKYYTRVMAAFTGETAAQFFKTKALVKLLTDFRKGQTENWRIIYTIYAFLVWYEQYFVLR